MLGWEEVVVVRVEGPFTLLSPREMDGLRALGVDLEHCDYWVVGGGGEALLANTHGSAWLTGAWGVVAGHLGTGFLSRLCVCVAWRIVAGQYRLEEGR